MGSPGPAEIVHAHLKVPKTPKAVGLAANVADTSRARQPLPEQCFKRFIPVCETQPVCRRAGNARHAGVFRAALAVTFSPLCQEEQIDFFGQQGIHTLPDRTGCDLPIAGGGKVREGVQRPDHVQGFVDSPLNA